MFPFERARLKVTLGWPSIRFDGSLLIYYFVGVVVVYRGAHRIPYTYARPRLWYTRAYFSPPENVGPVLTAAKFY